MSTAPAQIERWEESCSSVAEIESALAGLRLSGARERAGELPYLRTSVLTHTAWVPEEWREAALDALAGLAERHPSRTLLLFPDPDGEDRIDARVSLLAFELEGSDRRLWSDVVELTLGGRRIEAAASIVVPLLLPDLPVFLRWRGRPPFGAPELERLLDVVDRLVVDSQEWLDVPSAYRDLGERFDRAAVSDIAWRRTLPWRRALARAWPDLPDRVAGPPAEAALVAGWLRSRTGAEVALGQADELPFADPKDASDLLSEELDVFSRDPVYEAAALAGANLMVEG